MKEFSSDNLKRLQQLFVELSFSETPVLQGRLGAPNVNPFEVIQKQFSQASCRDLLSQVKQAISKLTPSDDDWLSEETVDSKRVIVLKKWAEFLNLAVGFKLSVAIVEKQATEIEKLKKQAAGLENSLKTPEQQLAELQAKIKEMGG